ncbi:probable serine/threonine-protein kinase PBL19 [Zea mays]|uniref:Putative receptor-like protein kinase n=1 Tax=Zea mays TaxID=4577 RepID=A0A1D6E470_MAIZE|nr:probable serine/threonine-protein kinase PBL19 [Zea mays]ONM15310.1 putative receptor-like protein kinase [Zea mays]|eukprot:XP_008669067.1 probable serine/threonine-protein kinase PBL19 [Zea mays]
MGCLRLFNGRFKTKRSKRRPLATAPAPAPAASAEARSMASAAAASCASFASSANVSETSASGSGSASSARSIPELYEERGALREFGLRELRVATRDFSPLLMVGEGGFGCVYRGVLRLPGSTPVAVKRLNLNGRQGHKEWLAEVHFLGVVEHRNLVKLIGYCASQTDRGPQRLLVYEFMPNKTLDDHLFNRAYPVLPWEVRLQIALGAAEGLLYLHEGLELQIIYRDFKASNVLLDEEFRPKLSDFGLAREGPSEGQTHVSTAVMGTFGYAAPDYVRTGHLTTKSDVWSFGVVLYEILTARRSIERNRPKNEQKLLDWVRRHPPESDQLGQIMDPRLQGRYPTRGAAEVARLANGCLAKLGSNRPTMREVVEGLRRAMRHTEMDGFVVVAGAATEYQGSPPRAEEEAPGTPGAEDASAVAMAAEARKRRMLHLAALGNAADAHARRRLMLMTAAAAAPT